ncbi:chromosomal replication initiator protein DnaA [Lactiplantibacillus mudanjiangensis]|uniref:Chromosomal replication initiator protein DnaA n=1 Tax=Lactiplantibacillus mudanjiangensis TaxID=1296538 RepID=A0A660DV54_9LACO|nr:chromosomal replication initiator protein DnaA [Lactiplantibacillus mudanjiangensis]VDG20907.1 chromosomal replication initiator protein DnaA [Lactobacillus sp.] [Lactiplantibacillus mudanjiangensis]VDG22638.1 chromosomal replication initiator protein DnaA [Lactobacillus sp.] [Lactiplantibacillus mudanjiangensis]VDG26820.1 chromosomal replication initiator protein DnaA [Lactobacillus sp.] [Lactiplantibacillus mudanjiangensis]VDG31963.1 chromosomal replication initiator protein DnaA [Lactobac
MLERNDLWNIIKFSLKSDLSPMTFQTFVEPANPLQLNQSQMTIEVPTKLHRDYWENNLADKFRDYAFQATNEEISPVMITEEERQQLTKKSQAATGNVASAETATATTPTFMRETKLNPKYTFESFVIGKGNQMAHAAALVVSEEPGTMYNPLFFYGGVGLGKTHLMHAIGNKLLESNPNYRVKYVTSEAFTNDLITAIQTGRQKAFRETYRDVDLLLVDDIQFFANKEATQEEFFHTFNALYEDDKQIVLTSDRLPNEIPQLQDRLVSRFKWGLSVDITPPDLETRIAILRNKADLEGIAIPDDTLSYIAGQIDSNVRELEGALARVQAYSRLNNSPISTSLVADALKSLNLSNKLSEVSIPVIQEKVAKYYHLTMADLKGKKRNKQIVTPRQIAMYLSRELTDSSLPRIGNEFGGKDHTTVIHAYDKISAALKTDIELQQAIGDLKSQLKA